MHAVEFLKQPPDQIAAVVVLTGGQRYLKQSALTVLRKLVIDNDENSFVRFPGPESTLQAVSDDLRTVSMWGDRRLVLVDDADDFVTKYRGGIEKLVDKPAKKSVLVLDVTTWPKTTRLYKQVLAKGLAIDCSELKGLQLMKWLQDMAKQLYGQSLSRDAASLLIELIGEEFGVLDSELAKVATYVGQKGKIEFEDVKSLVGGWRAETTWVMTDAARDDHLGLAFNALDRLLTAGEPSLKLLGGISFTFKKFGLATELSRSVSLDQALRQAGTFPNAVAPGQSYLRRLGRAKAERILERLIATDAGIKGASPLPERILLERLLVELSGRL